MNKFLFLFLLIFLNSCGVKRIVTETSIPPKSAIELIKRVNDKKKTPEYLNLKGKAELITKHHRTSLNISIKNRRDSVIWISGNGFFGIEMFRAIITPDSVCFLNRINRTYFKKTIQQLNKIIKTS